MTRKGSLSCAGVPQPMVKDEAFLDLEQSLSTLTGKRWDSIARRIDPQIVKAIKDRDPDAVVSILDTVNYERLYKGNIKRIRALLKTGLLFGASRVDGTAKDLIVLASDEVMAHVDLAVTQYKLQLRELVNTVKKRYIRVANAAMDALNEEVSKADALNIKKATKAINLPDTVGRNASRVGRSMLNIASSLQMSRVAAYGYSAEAHFRGITTYQINEQLDSRTCPVCKRMHGKTFQVQDALRKLDALIRIDDPNDLKLLAPWPKQDPASVAELDKMTTEQLRAKGYDTPPYHPHCRGLLKTAKKQRRDTPGDALQAQLERRLLPDHIKPPTDDEVRSFLDALGPLIDQSTKGYVNVITDGGTVEEATALVGYTSSLYRPLNRIIRNRDVPKRMTSVADNASFHTMERILNRWLARQEKYDKDVIREVKSKESPEVWKRRFTVGTVLERQDNGFLSTSREKSSYQAGTGNLDEEVGGIPNGGSYLWVRIRNPKSGVAIERYSSMRELEKEVLFPTTARFKVTAATQLDNRFLVELEEV